MGPLLCNTARLLSSEGWHGFRVKSTSLTVHFVEVQSFLTRPPLSRGRPAVPALKRAAVGFILCQSSGPGPGRRPRACCQAGPQPQVISTKILKFWEFPNFVPKIASFCSEIPKTECWEIFSAPRDLRRGNDPSDIQNVRKVHGMTRYN